MKFKVLVIDDFYDKPELIREEALQADFLTGGTYPGKDSNGDKFTQDMIVKFGSIMGRPLYPMSNTGNYRLSLKGDKASRHIHFDSNVYVASICLTLDNDCKGGVALWKHKETGIEDIPLKDSDIENKYGINHSYLENEIVLKQGVDESNFEQTTYVPYKFNRCVILYGRQFHSPYPQGWGDSPENGRLTQHFFFKPV